MKCYKESIFQKVVKNFQVFLAFSEIHRIFAIIKVAIGNLRANFQCARLHFAIMLHN